jgi:hypothetical protein
MGFSQPARGAGRELERLARSLLPKATLLVTALVILSLHRMLEDSLSAYPLVPTLLNWGATVAVAWVLILQIIESAKSVVGAVTDLVVEVLRSVRRIADCWNRERPRPRAPVSRERAQGGDLRPHLRRKNPSLGTPPTPCSPRARGLACDVYSVSPLSQAGGCPTKEGG